MPTHAARNTRSTYHHGDLRDALVKAAMQAAERGGPEAINISALSKKLGVSQPAPYRHFADREALLQAVTAEAFRQFNALMREAIAGASPRSKLSRFARAALDFGLQRHGIYRLMFACRTMACAPEDNELHQASRETFDLLLEALESPAAGRSRERHALQIWAALHGVVMLDEQGLLAGRAAHVMREELLDDFVAQVKSACRSPSKRRERPARTRHL
ncbi:AcrR family transcriptional regulator [Bradyrhizobium sp. USDA 4503]